MVSTNINLQPSGVCKNKRANSLKQKPHCIWLTGLSGSGKSTIANGLEIALHEFGKYVYVLDGDNIRHGLNSDLGFSDQDRIENIRRIGEVSHLMVDAGLIVIVAFISPFKVDRERVRQLFNENEFIEVFVNAPLSICEERDPKGHYKQARKGLIKDFTGIDSLYETPENSELIINTNIQTIDECIQEILNYLKKKKLLIS